MSPSSTGVLNPLCLHRYQGAHCTLEKEGKTWSHVPYISLVQYYIAHDKNYPEFEKRRDRFAKGCLAERNHRDLRKPLSCERLAARRYPGQVSIFAFFCRNSLRLWPERHWCLGGPLADGVRPFPGKTSLPRARVSSWVSSWTASACAACTRLPSVGAGPRGSGSLCSLDLPASCQKQSKSWCAAQNAAGSANFRSRALSFPSNSKDCSLKPSLSTGRCVSLTEKDTACKNLPP